MFMKGLFYFKTLYSVVTQKYFYLGVKDVILINSFQSEIKYS